MQKASGISEGTGGQGDRGTITALCFSQIFGENYVHSMIKFVFFEKANKFDEIFTLLLTNTSFSMFPARLLNFCQEKNN